MTETISQVIQVQVSQEPAPEEGYIGRRYLQLDALKEQGLLIDLDITGTSMFARSLDWAELGVDYTSIRAERMTPGRKFLYPKDEVAKLNTVVSRMRQAFQKWCKDISGFRPSRYLHYKVYAHWKREWAELLSEFEAVKQDLIDRHDEIVDHFVEEFRQCAAESWRAALGTGAEWIFFDGHNYESLDEFTDAVVAKALQKFPSIEQMERDIRADYRVSKIYGLEEIARDEAKAALEKERAKAAAQEAYLQSAILQEQYDHEQRMARLSEQEKELAIEAMMHAEAEHAREQLKSITSPFGEVMEGLRRQFAEDAAEMLASIQKNGFCRGKVAERGRGLLEMYELMSIQDDALLRARLEQLKAVIGAVGEERGKSAPARSTDDVVKALESIKELAHSAAEDLAAGPSRFAMLE